MTLGKTTLNMMYTRNAGICYYKRDERFFKDIGWKEVEITKYEYDYARNAGICYYKRGERFFKDTGWKEVEITKYEYDYARGIKK